MFHPLMLAHIKGQYTIHTDPAATPFASVWEQLHINQATQMHTGEWMLHTKPIKATYYGAYTYSFKDGQLHLHYGIAPALDHLAGAQTELLSKALKPN